MLAGRLAQGWQHHVWLHEQQPVQGEVGRMAHRLLITVVTQGHQLGG